MPELKTRRIYLDYYAYTGPIVNGHPAYPYLDLGKTYVFPLVAKGRHWRLLSDEGYGLVVPAIEMERAGGMPGSKREFFMRELVNTLLNGSYQDLYRFSLYMQVRPATELNDEIMAAIGSKLPHGDRRWLDISTALLAVIGIPRRPLDEFISGTGPKYPFPFAPTLLAARALGEVPEGERREGILRNMLQFSATHEWGTAATLVPEFKDDPLLLELLSYYLKRRQTGALYTACWLVSSGQRALIDITLDTALKCLMARDSDYSEVDAACALLVRHGSEQQFDHYLRILKDAKLRSARRYSQMWQIAWEDKSPRIMRILAVLLDDERRSSRAFDVRNCDFGGALLERVAGVKFGFKEWGKMSLPERNAAVQRARAWMAKQTVAAKY